MSKKILSLLLLFCIVFGVSGQAQAEEASLEVSAKAAILIDADSGRVLWSKNEKEQLSMASTTKIMTALLTLEQAALDDRCVTITEEMIRTEGSSMYLKAGDQLTLKALAAGMLIVSGNDAANSAAIALDGSMEQFAQRMNGRARELGMENSHFVTPSGLDDPEHYSCANDMALLAAAALKNPAFASIVSKKSMEVEFVNPPKKQILTNHNKLLSQYDACIGVKTGFTTKSGRCLVSAAERDGVRLIAVTLNAPDDWNDHKRLLDYGFEQMVCYPIDDSGLTLSLSVTGGVTPTITACGVKGEDKVLIRGEEQQVKRVVEAPQFLYAPVSQGQIVGRVKYILGDRVLAETDLVAQEESLMREPNMSVIQKFVRWFVRFFRLE